MGMSKREARTRAVVFFLTVMALYVIDVLVLVARFFWDEVVPECKRAWKILRTGEFR